MVGTQFVEERKRDTSLRASDQAGSILEKTGENRMIFQGIGLSFQGLEELQLYNPTLEASSPGLASVPSHLLSALAEHVKSVHYNT